MWIASVLHVKTFTQLYKNKLLFHEQKKTIYLKFCGLSVNDCVIMM